MPITSGPIHSRVSRRAIDVSDRAYALSMSVLWLLTVALMVIEAVLVWTDVFQGYNPLLGLTTVLLLALFVVDSVGLIRYYSR